MEPLLPSESETKTNKAPEKPNTLADAEALVAARAEAERKRRVADELALQQSRAPGQAALKTYCDEVWEQAVRECADLGEWFVIVNVVDNKEPAWLARLLGISFSQTCLCMDIARSVSNTPDLVRDDIVRVMSRVGWHIQTRMCLHWCSCACRALACRGRFWISTANPTQAQSPPRSSRCRASR